MDDAATLALLSDKAIVTALSAVRIATAFLVVPVFSIKTIPAIVRNTMFFSMALISVWVQPTETDLTLTAAIWTELFAKEIFIGIAVGIYFGLFLWAFEAAGVIVDTQVGMSFAQSFDPIIGNEATLIGKFLSQWSVYLFVASGGLLFLVGALLESFAVWPLLVPIGGIREASSMLFYAEMSRFMNLAIRIAGPLLIVMFLVDVALGLMNRSAQHFNVFFLAAPIKALACIVVLIIILPFLSEQLVSQLAVQAGTIESYLSRLMK